MIFGLIVLVMLLAFAGLFVFSMRLATGRPRALDVIGFIGCAGVTAISAVTILGIFLTHSG